MIVTLLLTMVDRSEAHHAFRTINGRSLLQLDKTEIVSLRDRPSNLISDILQNQEDIADIRENYIPQNGEARSDRLGVGRSAAK